MASDITEEFQVDITNQSTASVATDNSGITYDIAFNGQGFFDASSQQNPYRRQTAPYKKDQNDNSAEPGEQTLTGWWLRSQSSFHMGAGIDFYEPSQEQSYVQNQTIRFRFKNSEGVNVWTPGKVSLLKDVSSVAGVTRAGSDLANLRSYSGGVLYKDGNDIYKIATDGTSTQLVDFSETVYAWADDGTSIYWVANVSSKGTLYKKPISSSTASTSASLGDATQLYQHPSAASTSVVIEWAKDRLVVGDGSVIWVHAGTVSSPDTVYTGNDTSFAYTCVAESPADIYVAGYSGSRSVIYRIYFAPNASDIPEPVTAVVVAEMPRGEVVHSMKYYLGNLVIGTSKGVRVASVQSDGSLVYGPLLFESEQPVYQIAVSDRFAWVTNKIGGDAGLTRIDLSLQIDNLVFPYANDLQSVGTAKTVTGVAMLDNTDRVAFCTIGSSGALYFESASTLRTNGFIETGLIRFATLENKFFKYIKERADYSFGGTIGISTADSSIVTVDATTGNQDIGVPEKDADDVKAFIFTLNRNASTTSQGPTLYGYQLKALPATKRQRLVQYNVFCFDTEIDRNRNMTGYKGRAFERLAVFETLEESSDIVTVQDFRTGETFQGLIEETSFTGVTAPLRNFSGFGGVLTVTVRKI